MERAFGWAGLAFVVKAKRLESEERKKRKNQRSAALQPIIHGFLFFAFQLPCFVFCIYF